MAEMMIKTTLQQVLRNPSICKDMDFEHLMAFAAEKLDELEKELQECIGVMEQHNSAADHLINRNQELQRRVDDLMKSDFELRKQLGLLVLVAPPSGRVPSETTIPTSEILNG